MTTKNYTIIINSFFINVTVARNPFKKRLDRKTKQRRGRRDQTAQRLQLNGCGSIVAAQWLRLNSCGSVVAAQWLQFNGC